MMRRNLLLITLFLCSGAAARAEQQWIEVRTAHFSVATDGGEKRAREVALRFEQMRTAFGALFQKISVNTAPLQIIAFRNSKELRQFAPIFGGKPIELSGFFLGNGGHGGPGAGEDRQYIALDLSADDNWGTVFHEYAHLLINSNFPPSPVWFDEGFAEYCSSLKIDKKEISLGLVKPELPELLMQSRWLRLVDLFSVSHDSKIYNRDDRRSLFYAQSWVTVHFFMARKMMKQVSDYVRLTEDQHVPVPEAIRRSFGMEPEALEKAIEGYLRGGVMYFHGPAPPGSDAVQFTSRPLNDLDVKTVLADLDFHARDYHQRGVTAFREILRQQPENVVANRALGYEALQRNNWDEAAEYFQRAAAQDVKDPQVHYLLATMLSRRGMATGNRENLATIKKELTTAIALDANYADAYNLLGMTLSFAGEKQEAIAALTKAIALSPRNPWYVGNLANAYLQAQDFDHAIALLQELQKSSEPQVAARAGQQLQQVETFRSAVNQSDAYSRSLTNTAGPAEIKGGPDETTSIAVSRPAEPILFMKGVLISVDCSTIPTTLTISSAGTRWRMLAPAERKLVVMGADELSCSWTNKKVALNYRKTGTEQGNLVSLELQ